LNGKNSAMKVGYVALIGRPNVGKSMLLNRMLGEKVAIVSNKPQTTRISILGIKTTAAGQIIFIDNPGIHKPLHSLNKRMMQFVYSALESADLLCLLVDATQRHGHGDEFVIETLRKVRTPIILLINKVDAVRKDTLLPIIDKYKDLLDFKEIIPISALTGINLDVLEKKIYEFLPEAEKLYDDDTVTDQTLRFMLAEIIREKLLKRVEEELPFVTAVLIERIEERKRGEGEPERSLEPFPDPFASGAPSSAQTGDSEAGDQAIAEADDSGLEAAPCGAATPEAPNRVAAAGRDVVMKKRAGAEPKALREAPNRVGEAPSRVGGSSSRKWADLSIGRSTGKAGVQPGLKPLRKKRGKERNKVAYISAAIFVEKDNHRKIVIGRRGQVIKEIGIEARREIEDILDANVYLELKVKVKHRWRDSAEVLDLIEGQR
jgi:GTP-binding protein Era